MTVATVGALPAGPEPGVAARSAVAGDRAGGASTRPAGTGNAPHAASVFYAMDDSLGLIFLSKPSSLHGEHIGDRASVAATVSEGYEDWEKIQGVQLWGEARRLRGAARARGLAVYLGKFPFVKDILKRPGMASLLTGMGVYRLQPRRLSLTDNTTGVFGREVLDLVVE